MEDAQSFIYIAVMNYLPTMEFSHPKRCIRSSSFVDLYFRPCLFSSAVTAELLVCLLLQVLGSHRYPAEESGVRKEG